MKILIGFQIIFLSICVRAEKPFERTYSPDRSVVVVETKDNYVFSNLRSGKTLGKINLGEVSKVDIVASWNSDSTCVALLIYYGTKSNSLSIYKKESDGLFRELHFSSPPLSSLFDLKNATTSGYSENAVGPWIKSNKVKLICGEAKEFDDYTRHYLVSFEVEITEKGKCKILTTEKIGILNDDQSAKFLSKWGEQYF